jgi:hypothetical protein
MGSSLRIRFRNTAAPSIELLIDQSEARRFKSLDEVVKSISRWSRWKKFLLRHFENFG